MTFFCKQRHDNHVENFSNNLPSCVCSISPDIPIERLHARDPTSSKCALEKSG